MKEDTLLKSEPEWKQKLFCRTVVNFLDNQQDLYLDRPQERNQVATDTGPTRGSNQKRLKDHHTSPQLMTKSRMY